jgi:PAS domain S-box-containing protein
VPSSNAVQTSAAQTEAVLASFEQAPVGLVVFDAERRVIAFNPRFGDMLRVGPGELVGRSLPTLLANLVADHADAPSVGVTTLPDGWPALVHVSPLRSPDGAITGGHAVVTHLEMLRQATNDGQALFHAFAEHSPAGMFIMRRGRFVYVNPRLAEMFGYTVEELLALDDALFTVTPEDRESVRARIEERRSGGTAMRYGTHGLRKDGTTFSLDVLGSTIVQDGERLAIGTLVDVSERVQAAAALREEQQKLEATLESLPVGVWIVDSTGSVRTNAAATAVVDRGLVATKPREEWPMVRTVERGETVVGEPLELTAPDGTVASVLASSAPLRDQDGRVVGAVGALLDVTEQQRSVRERERLLGSLEFERKRLAMVFAQAPGFLCVLRGPEHVIELTNARLEALCAKPVLVGKRIIDAIPEFEEQGFILLLDHVLESGQPFVGTEMRVVFEREGGASEMRFLDFVYQPIVEEDGSHSGILVHGVDVTDRVLANRALRESERRGRAQFEAIPVPTFAWQRAPGDGQDFVLVDYNDAATELTAGGVAQLVGTRATAFYADRPEMLGDLRVVAAGGAAERRTIDQRFSNGASKRLSLSYTAVLPDLVLVHAEDITARTELEEQLRQAQKMEAVGQLAGGVAHDFNNLLTIITTCGSFLADELPADSPLHADVSDIRDAAMRAATLTRQLLAFSRRQVLVPTVLDLNEVAGSLEPMLKRLIGEDIRVVVERDPALERVAADRGQIEQIVLNLAVNARDAMPNGGSLTIRTANRELDLDTASRHGVEPGTYVILSVRDTGIGMDAETMKRIFEPFFTTKEQGKGTGLGLPTVYGIARQSGGFVDVLSRLGEGTTFEIGLPRSAPEQTASPASSGAFPKARAGSERILLVEDDATVRGLTRRLLERQGYTVFEAADGRHALEVAGRIEGGFDLLLTDLVMPEAGGRLLHAALAERIADLRVLYMSGYTSDEIVRRGMHAQGVTYLQKPFTRDELSDAVRGAMRRASRYPQLALAR